MPTIAVSDPYPTRAPWLTRNQWYPRVDPVLYGRPPARDYFGHRIPGQDIASAFPRSAYASLGYVTLSPFFDASTVRDAVAAADALFTAPAPEAILEPNSAMVRSVFAVHKYPAFDRLSRHPALLALARDILGDSVYIHQSRINYKAGLSSTGWSWHSDFETWHAEDGMPRMRAVTAMIALSDNVESNGPLMVIPGSHQRFLACVGDTPIGNYKQHLQDQVLGVPDEASLLEWIRGADGRLDSLPCETGSVVLFDSNIIHGSNSNITPWKRTNLFIVYNSWQNRLVDPYCGTPPRPEHVATRAHPERLTDLRDAAFMPLGPNRGV